MQWLKQQWSWLRWVVTVAILYGLWRLNQNELAKFADREIRWPFLAAAAGVAFTATILTFVRWYLLVRALDFPFRLREAIGLGFLGQLSSYVMPGTLGGDVIKAVWLAKDQTSRRLTAASTVLLDRVLGLMALFFVGAFASLLPTSVVMRPELKIVVAGLWAGTAGSAAALAVLMTPALTHSRPVLWMAGWRRVGRFVQGFLDIAALYQSRRTSIAMAILLSLFGHVGILSSFYLAALGLHGSQLAEGRVIPDYAGHLLYIPAAEIFAVMFPTPGGLGALEGAVQAVYGLAAGLSASPEVIAAAESDGLLTALAFRAIVLVISSLGLVFYLSSRRKIAALTESA